MAKNNMKKLTLKEQYFKDVLHKYNLYDGLIVCGKASSYIFRSMDENCTEKFMYINPVTKKGTTQSSLAYLANMLLVSGSNDYKSRFLSQEINFFEELNYLYTEELIEHMASEEIESLSSSDQLNLLMLRMAKEQISFQFSIPDRFARYWVIFRKFIKEEYKDFFKEQTGLTTEEYLKLIICVSAMSADTATIHSIEISEDIAQSHLGSFITKDNILKFIKSLSANYNLLRETDQELNQGLLEHLTKLRFNPLDKYPIVKIDHKYRGQAMYIIPNQVIFYRTAMNLFWWFHGHYEKLDQYNKVSFNSKDSQTKKFRDAFGLAFEKYVGYLLKQIFGSKCSEGDFSYKNKLGNVVKFSDYYLDFGDKIYLIEVKAYQYSLAAGQLDLNAVQEANKRIAEGFGQLLIIINDIHSLQEPKLQKFKNKQLIPLLITMDMSWLDMRVEIGQTTLLQDSLVQVESSDQKYIRLAQFKPYIINIDRVESYFNALRDNKATLEELSHHIGEVNFEVSSEEHKRFVQGNDFASQVWSQLLK